MLRAAFIFSLLLLPSTADAAKRVTLVIGNSAYQHSPKLDNPKNDATDVATALKASGFEVIAALDLDKASSIARSETFRPRFPVLKAVCSSTPGTDCRLPARITSC